MTKGSMPSGDEIVGRPLTIPGPNGRLVRSFALMDRGINPLDYFLPDQNILRVELGDMRFVGSFGPGGRLLRLFFAPEYPSEKYDSIRGYLTYFGILLSERAEESDALYQLRAWDINTRRIQWENGIELVNELDTTRLSDYQTEIICRIKSINENRASRRPNLSLTAMREAVGSPTGGRLEIKPFVFS